MVKRILAVLGALCLYAQGGAAQSQLPAADLILHHGKIAVVDDAFSIHQAIVVKDGKVLASGGNDLVKAYRATQTIDLGGRTVIPGFNDTHIHLSGQARRHLNLAGSKSLVEIKRKIAEKAKELGPGEWVTGSAWSEDELVERRRPLRKDLDEAAPQNPVIITRAGGHSAVASSLALELAGVTRDTPNPEGGVIERDEKGELNGVIRERQGIVSRLVPRASREELRASFVQNIRNLLRLGITSFTLAGTSPDGYAEWESMYREFGSELPRATVQIRWATPADRGGGDQVSWGGPEKMKAFGRKTGDGTDRLKLGAVKISVDGGFTGPAAYTLQPYKGQGSYRGFLNYTEEQLYQIVKAGHDLGWQMGFHTIGDGAIKMTVDVFERVLRESPRANHRHYLTHFTVPPPEATLKQMAANQILIAQQPNFTYTLEGRYAENLDGYRLEHNNPVRTPMKHGIFVAFSADVLPIGPLVGLYAAVTRKGLSGKVWGADEAVTMPEAIRAYTRNAAYVNFDERVKGTLEVGKLADMIVLNEDLLTITPSRILGVKVDLTIVGGRIVFDRSKTTTN
ncbi:MAG: amidohydrolase [Acidobacteria bacterium]|nr:amidohydrolase [Acidobacteriota bacterium]